VRARYTEEAAAAAEIARLAGELLLEHRAGTLAVAEKADRSLVTSADLAAERLILARLRERFPEDAVLSEEAGACGSPSGRQWLVDPLDGTSNYSRGLPMFAVSMALWDGGVPAAAAVFLPVLGELFTAVRGGPAQLNGREIRVSGTGTLAAAMVNVYFDRHRRLEEGLEVFRRVALRCEGRVKTMGSTASLLCYVACGRLDAFVRNATLQWDFAAGALVLERAGGRVTDFHERPLRENGQSLLATNGRIHAELAAVARGD